MTDETIRSRFPGHFEDLNHRNAAGAEPARAMRGELPLRGSLPPVEVLEIHGRPDVAIVFVGRLGGPSGPVVEFVDGLDVRFPREEKWIVNVSTQAGCPVGCPFCDAGGDFKGNLTANDILAQAAFVLARHPGLPGRCRKLKVHFARMGEPALNDAVLDALALLPTLPELADCPGPWACVPTTAPRGRERWFEGLREIKETFYPGRFQLQFSVNSTDEEERNRLMPHPHWTLGQVAAFGRRFAAPGDRKPVLNFALARGIACDPAVIRRTFDPACFAVKLTPLNPTARAAEHGLQTVLRSEAEPRLREVGEELATAGFEVIFSVGDGREDRIGSNCGQAVRRMRE